MAGEDVVGRLRAGKLPQMVRWYDPRLLAKVGIRTMVSSVFGQYADQRLIQAATDQNVGDTIVGRYDFSNTDDPREDHRLPVDPEGAVWVDYIADTGDGFEATYTTAYLMALDNLRLAAPNGKNRLKLQHGSLLIMGGDQCYPQATREDYKKRLVEPYRWAFDVPQPKRKLFAIPGNHDWYDGLAAFDSLFCAARAEGEGGRGTVIGGWQCRQHRSYWALKLPYDWWIWGTDIQFSKYLDGAQVAYFERMAAQMQPGDKLIICLAEPSWLLTNFGQEDEEENFFHITSIARQAGAEICAVIAGDWHNYAHYYTDTIDVHFITAGGGGSFLHPTHVLKNEIKVDWPAQTFGAEASAHGPPGWTKSKVDIRLKPTKASTKNGPATTPIAKAGEAVAEVREEVGQAVKEVGAAVEKALTPPAIAKQAPRPAPATKSREPKLYPGAWTSRMISLGNLAFPFRNFAFAMGIGSLYWLITWEYYSVVSRHDISSGEIDAVGVSTFFWDVLRYTPFYLIQALLVSIPLALMLSGVWFLLVMYVDAGERRGAARAVRKGLIGTTHFAAHLAAMFALALAFVGFNNVISPVAYDIANTYWRSSARDEASIAKKVLDPLSQDRQRKRDVYEADSRASGQSSNRPAPPTQASAQRSDSLDPKAVRSLIGFVFYPLQMILIGGFVGGFIWGLYWVITGLCFRMHAEDAFGALRNPHYRNFLRMKFERDRLTIYPIGLDRLPRTTDWLGRDRLRGRPLPSNNPHLVPKDEIPVRLIEAPIVIERPRLGA